MPTMKELHALHLRQLDTTLADSELLLQREGGLDGELKTSGALCERFVRQTLQRYIVPGHFRITSGYVATPSLLQNRENLPQCDILLVDRDTRPLLRFDDADIEVVPRESVCGIIEVKRTLTKQTLLDDRGYGALNHLASIIDSFGESSTLKTDATLTRLNRHLAIHNHSSDKPLLGIIALQNQIADFPKEVGQRIERSDSLIDFIWTLDGHALLPAFHGREPQLFSHTARPETKTWTKLTIEDFKSASSPFFKYFDGRPAWASMTPADGLDRAAVFARVLAVASLMLSRIFSNPLREEQITQYYLKGV